MHKKRRIAKNGKVVDNQEMERLQLPADEEIGKAFDQGKEAMIALFHITIRQLAARIQGLEDRVSKNSQNSGKPPSSDGLKSYWKYDQAHIPHLGIADFRNIG